MKQGFIEKSIALQYDKDAPKIIASARGILAEKMIKIAKEKKITIYKDEDLAEILSKFKAGDLIPENLFGAVSVVMAYCYSINSDFRQKINNSGLLNG
ncbi:MAG TPA: EscU/YscU/HrcU family type III secretion system export apparatus switch protein [Spirochaetota bacterium]|nr:EscU/YscU/HrcU family type III secretion system export apparatus switch protein [Spirochaetota bacterium]